MADLTANGAAKTLPAHGVSFGEALRVWLRVAALSFGGPAGQIAVMHRIIVDEKHWVGERRFLHALSYCMLLPGPEAQQLATYIGWLMHRWPGAIAAGGLFVVPGIIAIMALSWIYALYGQVPVVAALFFGLKAAVLAIVLFAVYRVGSRALKSGAMTPSSSARGTGPAATRSMTAGSVRNCRRTRGRRSDVRCVFRRSGWCCGLAPLSRFSSRSERDTPSLRSAASSRRWRS